MSANLRLATLRAMLPSYASVERVELDAAGYDARGKYWGRGLLFRLYTDAESGMQLDWCVRCYSEKAAIELLLACIKTYTERFAYWKTQTDLRKPTMGAFEWDDWCDRAAMRDVAALG
jgi:hypothetical protein